MIKENTLFVLGAGAHIPYGFPSGQKLVKVILNALEDHEFSQEELSLQTGLAHILTSQTGLVENRILHIFKDRLKKSGRLSIDKFLRDQNDSFSNFGKKFIGLILSLYESSCDPFNGTNNTKDVKYDHNESIYHHLFDAMDVSDNENFFDNSVKFLTYNYDRSLEYFFAESVINSYPEIKNQIKEFFNNDIIHVHGSLGKLASSTAGFDSFEGEYPFGWLSPEEPEFNYKIKSFSQLGNDIRIISDGLSDSITKKCLEFLDWSDRVVFLGFAYDRQNLSNIGFIPENQNYFTGKKIYGSTFGLTLKEINEIESYFRKVNGKVSVNLDKSGTLKSVAFLRNHVSL